MRIAVISDIHGNLTALRTILPEIKEVDRVVCLGDVAAVGPQPHEVIAFLRKTKWPCVMGNADESLANSILGEYEKSKAPEDEKRRLRALDEWTSARLDQSDRRFLLGLKPTITIRDGRNSLLCYHGSPRSNTERITPTLPDDQVAKILGDRRATVFAGGHTHAQMIRRLGSSMIVNPGSVGLPFETDSAGKTVNPTWAEYSIVTFDGQNLGVELRRAGYEKAGLEKAVRASGMPNPDWWLADWR